MTHEEAKEMIRDGVPKSNAPARWLDLGAGSGIFTRALADLLCDGSAVVAIDKESKLMTQQFRGVKIEGHQLDFAADEIPFQQVDGVLMANSLHYVKDKAWLIEKLKKVMKSDACLIIIEYDTLKSNAWVPYPINFSSLSKLMADHRFTSIVKLNERQSIYNNSTMYSALVR